MKIGHAIRRLRHAQGRTLQQVCDATGGRIQTGYLSRIERDEMTPSVYVAGLIARVLGTTVDNLLAESEGIGQSSGFPAASRLLVPVLRWEEAAVFWRDRDYTTMPTPVRWVMPPMETHLGYFGLILRDDSMQALEGLSWSRGAVIIIDMSREPQPDEYVVVADPSDPTTPIFRQLISDGRQLYLRPRNPQYPMHPLPPNALLLGTVIGQVIDLTLVE